VRGEDANLQEATTTVMRKVVVWLDPGSLTKPYRTLRPGRQRYSAPLRNVRTRLDQLSDTKPETLTQRHEGNKGAEPIHKEKDLG
jgi:hypothetical protein